MENTFTDVVALSSAHEDVVCPITYALVDTNGDAITGSSIVIDTDTKKITVNKDIEVSKSMKIKMTFDTKVEYSNLFEIEVVKTPLVPSQSIADYTQFVGSSTTTVVTLEDAYTAGNTSEVDFTL